MQLSRRDDETRAHSPVGMDAQDLEIAAAVGPPAPAGRASLAIHVRLDRATAANLDVLHIRPDLQHLHAKLVSRDARIAEEGHLAEITADVRAADADAMDANQRFSGGGAG